MPVDEPNIKRKLFSKTQTARYVCCLYLLVSMLNMYSRKKSVTIQQSLEETDTDDLAIKPKRKYVSSILTYTTDADWFNLDQLGNEVDSLDRWLMNWSRSKTNKANVKSICTLILLELVVFLLLVHPLNRLITCDVPCCLSLSDVKSLDSRKAYQP